ncbi:glycosyltransferase [Erwinia tracheiphila]|uniref:glycosyltransferase family 2 protein n=1 Tax=Erwinia tracheiphila TaxID=65700 RepID=UPI001F2B6778|nr:glycosyltransferase family 2 protein [Erwinia tracheiphila]UIA81839.1 glycosyltransferase [Erwinia tracheiphila]UIA90435.1 glycosyltransferase [Erwinia tracheiphila]
MKPEIDVSVIIPAFNAQATIGHLVHKLLSEQTLRMEVIVVDNGSTDETWTILSAITDERLMLIHQENQGVYAARNAALAVHGGEWVVFLDADDQVADGFLQERLRAAHETQADVAVFNGWRVDNAGLQHSPVHCKISSISIMRFSHRKAHFHTPLISVALTPSGFGNLQYTRALLAYRQSSPDADDIAKAAIDSNRHIPGLLSKCRLQLKSNSGYITLGGMDEAIYYVNNNIKPWIRTAGTIEWIVNRI